jgi:thiol-disulfide isomerase/thioredoxin
MRSSLSRAAVASTRLGTILLGTVLLGTVLVGCGDAGSSSNADVIARLEAIDQRLAKIETRLEERRVERVTSPSPTKASVSTKVPTATQAPQRAEGAVIVLESSSHDFGQIWSGPPLAHVFRLRNDGDAPLEILGITPSCTCLVLGDYPKSIAPGAESEIPLQLETVKLKGQVRQTAVVRTNDPKTPELTLTMSGLVRPVIQFESFVLIRTRPGDGPVERRVKIAYQREGELELEMATRAEDRFDVELVETVPGKTFDLVVRVAPPFKIGYERTVVTLKTNLPERKTINVRLNLHIPDRLDVIPNQLLVDDRTGKAVTRQLTLTNYGEGPVTVLEATIDDPKAKTVLATRETGKVYAITVSFPAGFRLPAGGRKLTLRTDDTEKPIVEVPIRALSSYQPPKSTGKRAQRPALALVDKPAPSFSLATVDGDEVSTKALAASPATILNFFAPNCGYCKRQLPLVEKVRAAFEERGVRFVNVREVMGQPFSIEATDTVLAQLGVDLELAVDEGNAIGKKFQVTGYPTLFLVDRKGTVRHVRVGAGANIAEDLSTRLEKMLAADD